MTTETELKLSLFTSKAAIDPQRLAAAIAAMQALIAADSERAKHDVADEAVRYADCLLERLRE